MLYKSEILNKDFKSPEECLEAEEAYKIKLEQEKEKKEKLAAEKKERAQEVADAYKVIKEAEKKYLELRNAFIKDYGYFHMTYRDETPTSADPFYDFLNLIFHS